LSTSRGPSLLRRLDPSLGSMCRRQRIKYSWCVRA
jgi:hypothetical protein